MAKHAKHDVDVEHAASNETEALSPEAFEGEQQGEGAAEAGVAEYEDGQEDDFDGNAEAVGKHAAGASNGAAGVCEPLPVITESMVVGYDIAGNDAPEATRGLNLHQKKSRRMRIVLLVVSIVLVVLMCALGYFAFMLVNEARDVAQQSAVQAEQQQDAADASDAKASSTEVGQAPSLVGLLGMTEEEAISKIGSGATETSRKEVTEETGEGGSKKTEVVGANVTLTLTDEPSDSRGNAPSVYLALDKDGKITEVGYAASLSALGYKDVSFSDAVKSEHIVEKLLSDAGIPTTDGTVELPSTDDYRTYAEDGKTIAQEQYTFSGQGTSTDGTPRNWQCRLNYDYSAANVSGNLVDTLRQVYVTVSAA